MYSSNQNPDFSGRIINESTLDDVNKLEVYSLKEKLKVRDSRSTLPDLEDNDFLRDLQLTKYDGNVERLTVAGLLFVGKEKCYAVSRSCGRHLRAQGFCSSRCPLRHPGKSQ